jgi:hypothetical protein
MQIIAGSRIPDVFPPDPAMQTGERPRDAVLLQKHPETAPRVHKTFNKKINEYLTAPAEILFALETSE